MSIISRETSKKSTKTPVSHCGFCGKLVVADDTLYVSLSRRSYVGLDDRRDDVTKYRLDEVGFCVPCCRDCLSFWRKKFVKNVIFGLLFFLVGLFALLLCPESAIGIVCGVVYGIVILSMWRIRVKTLFPGGLLETLNLPWISELIEDGYSMKVIYPRHAQRRDMQEKNGEIEYFLDIDRRYYTWKGCVNFRSKRMLAKGLATWKVGLEIFFALLSAFPLFVFASGLLTIWIGSLVLIAYLYFGNGHQGETSFHPVVISLGLAIVLTIVWFGFFRLMSWICKWKSLDFALKSANWTDPKNW